MNKLVLIGGGSASGKSYVLKKVLENFPEEEVAFITLDNYYKNLGDLPFEERVKVNYDHPKAFDWKLIHKQIRELKEGKEIDMPVYDFVTHSRENRTIRITPKRLIIVEGIMALVNKDLRALGDLMVFISASRERRLIRRIERDTKERGRTYDSVIKQYFETVQPMFEEIISPSQYYADLIINNDGYSTKSIDVLISVLQNIIKE